MAYSVVLFHPSCYNSYKLAAEDALKDGVFEAGDGIERPDEATYESFIKWRYKKEFIEEARS